MERILTGKEYFENLSDENKEKILGKETFLAYQQNNLSLNDFVAFRNDKRFGKSVTRKPLAKILADKNPAIKFSTYREAKKWADSNFKEFEAKLTKTEADKLANYGWFDYKAINSHLRGLELPNNAPDVKTIKESIKNIDKAIKKGNIPQNINVFRGFGIKNKTEIKVNQILKDKAFSSVSLDKKIAERFYRAAKEDGFKPVLMEILLPKGLNAAYLENLSKMREVELLLERNTSFEILSVKEKSGVIYAKARWKKLETKR